MPLITVIYALLLIALGVGGYLITGQEHITALIPAFFGIPLLLLGLLALVKAGARKHAMHVAALLALLGIVGTASGIPAAITVLTGDATQVDRPEAAVAKAIMAVLSVLFLLWCIRSFIVARRARKDS